MQIFSRRPVAAVLVTLAFLISGPTAQADSNADANSLFVEAVLAWDQVAAITNDGERLRLLELVNNNLQQIVTDHSRTDLAVKLVVGDSIGSLSIPAVRASLAQAEAAAAVAQVWTDCIANPTPLCILDEVRRQSLTVPEAAESYYLDADAVRVLAAARQFDVASELAETFEIEAARDQAFEAIAIAQANAARVTDAHDTADRIVGASYKISALTQIATAEMAILLDDQARASLNAAYKLTGAVTDEGRLRTALDGIIKAMADLGLFDDAMRVATAIADAGDRDEAMSTIAVAQAKAGVLDAAIGTTAMIVTPGKLEWAQSAIAVAQAKAGLADAALATAALLTDPQRQAVALAGIAAALFANGDSASAATTLGRAMTIAEAQTESWTRSSAFNAIGTAQAEMGLTDDARESFDTALTAANDLGGDFGYFVEEFIAESLSDAGMPDQARQVLEQSRDLAMAMPDDDRGKLPRLLFIAQTAAELGQPDLADDVVRLGIGIAMQAPVAYDRIANLSYIAVRMAPRDD